MRGARGDEVDEVDEVDVADVAGVALALYAAERIVRTHHILAAVQAAARFEERWQLTAPWMQRVPHWQMLGWM